MRLISVNDQGQFLIKIKRKQEVSHGTYNWHEENV